MSGKLQDSVRSYQETSKGIAHEFRLSVGEAIIEGLREQGWNQKRLAEQLGVTEPLISRFLNGDHNWTSESVGKIGHALKIRFRAKTMPLRSRALMANTLIAKNSPRFAPAAISGNSSGLVFRIGDHISGEKNEEISINTSATPNVPAAALG